MFLNISKTQTYIKIKDCGKAQKEQSSLIHIPRRGILKARHRKPKYHAKRQNQS